MNAQHTPGPWSLESGRIVADETIEYICIMAEYDNGSINKADARLIAAAPNLLEACKAAVSTLECELTVEAQGCCSELDQIRAAIAKAEGKES